MGDEEIPEDAVSTEPVPGVRYTGSADARHIYLSDLQGIRKPGQDPGADYLAWDRGNGKFIPWGHFVDACGTEEQARAFLAANAFEFATENMDLELPEEEEFDIGGPEA